MVSVEEGIILPVWRKGTCGQYGSLNHMANVEQGTYGQSEEGNICSVLDREYMDSVGAWNILTVCGREHMVSVRQGTYGQCGER